MANGNIEKSNILIIFSEPQEYIFSKDYEKKLNVPTWNYISVHAYGQGKVISDFEKVYPLLESTIGNYEIEYKQQWHKLPQDYKTKM